MNESASANYIVDEQDPINFPVPLPRNGIFTNQKLFETGQLPLGQHQLTVTYLGNFTTVPLIFDHFVQHIELSSTSSNTPTSTSVPIIGGVIGGLVLISLLLALFFFNRRRNNRRPQAMSDMSSTVPSPEVVNPFTGTFPHLNPNSTMTFLPQNNTSNGQSLLSQSIPSKFSNQRDQPSDPAASTSSGGGIPPSSLTPLRPQFSSPAFTPSGSSPLQALPLTVSEFQTNHDDSTRTRVPQAATEPSMQRSPSPQGANVRFLRHDDSGVRIPAELEDDVVELPPFYTPE